jgi:hypothetical protein
VSQDFLGDDDIVPDSPERPASSSESFSSGTEDLGSWECEVDGEDSVEDNGGNSRASTPELFINKVEECFAFVDRLEVVLSKRPFRIPYFRFVSKSSPGANILFNVLFLSIADYFLLYSTVILQLPAPSAFREARNMLGTINTAAKNTQPTQTSESVTHISFSSALTHLLEQVSKLETAEASCSENNVDFRVLRDCLASYVSGSSSPLKTAGGMDLVLPQASTEQMLQAGRFFLLAAIYCLVPPTVQAEDASKTAFTRAQELFPHALEHLKNHLGVSSFNEIVGRNKRRTIDLLLKKEITASAMIMAGSDDEWTMPNVQAHFRAPSGLKNYMMILPCATSDTIIMRIMR